MNNQKAFISQLEQIFTLSENIRDLQQKIIQLDQEESVVRLDKAIWHLTKRRKLRDEMILRLNKMWDQLVSDFKKR